LIPEDRQQLFSSDTPSFGLIHRNFEHFGSICHFYTSTWKISISVITSLTKMGVPLFMIEDEIKTCDIAVYSSNYTLYGDMSSWVMGANR